MERVYNFAIVRVSPDPRRGELVNIGIVVYLRHRVDVRILPSLAKVQALHGELDLTQLHVLPTRMIEFAKGRRSVADRHAMLRKVGMVELSDLGQFSARNEAEYALTVEQLISQLVQPTAAKREREAPVSKLHGQVKKILRDAKILGRNQDDFDKHKIVSNYPLAPDKGLFADFAGMNSKSYITETIDYRVDRGIHGAKFNESAKAAFVLREALSQHVDGNRILLYAASSEIEALKTARAM